VAIIEASLFGDDLGFVLGDLSILIGVTVFVKELEIKRERTTTDLLGNPAVTIWSATKISKTGREQIRSILVDVRRRRASSKDWEDNALHATRMAMEVAILPGVITPSSLSLATNSLRGTPPLQTPCLSPCPTPAYPSPTPLARFRITKRKSPLADDIVRGPKNQAED
jgi:hypothetical protein